MEWDFTPEQVVRGDIGYRLSDFRHDLAREIRMNMDRGDALELARTYDLAYDLCYALATGRSYEEFVRGHAFDPPTVELLGLLHEPMGVNAEMLGAVLQRLIVDRVEAGMPLERAVEDVADHHRQVVAESKPISS
jgi:hypothetical protein